jgi:hypothetical protein
VRTDGDRYRFIRVARIIWGLRVVGHNELLFRVLRLKLAGVCLISCTVYKSISYERVELSLIYLPHKENLHSPNPFSVFLKDLKVNAQLNL